MKQKVKDRSLVLIDGLDIQEVIEDLQSRVDYLTEIGWTDCKLDLGDDSFICGDRLETDEEYGQRLASEVAWRLYEEEQIKAIEAKKEAKRAKDLKELARLKAKYEGKES
jgi:hypothetical protein